MKQPVRVAITGAAGNIGYAAAFRIAAGDMLGPGQPVILQLIEIEPALDALRGVKMELNDCAFPLLMGITATADLDEGFEATDYALLIGSQPRTGGMERSDLLSANGKIFAPQGKAINDRASRDIRVLVVGNPANTNALIAAGNAPEVPPRQFTSMMRLDHNRALTQLAIKTGTHVNDLRRMIVWGNHSASQFPDIRYCTVQGRPATECVTQDWYRDDFITTVQNRGAAIIEARGASSAASAASAAIDHMRNWVLGTAEGDWVSMGVATDGSYGIAEGLIYGYPVVCGNGEYRIVDDLEVEEYARRQLATSEQELRGERAVIESLL